ncbi:MAG: hypothetical protein IJ733_15045 [Lachnospiraceae bacterium]|nr:hypothetical protein [Lachnospiraceae bacterium]
MQLKLEYLYKDMVTTTIWADYRTRQIKIQNHTDNMLHRAFGVNSSPSFTDYENFLEERCFPRTRDHLKELLRDLELDYYDPLAIVRKTHGKLAGDFYQIHFADGEGGSHNEKQKTESF